MKERQESLERRLRKILRWSTCRIYIDARNRQALVNVSATKEHNNVLAWRKNYIIRDDQTESG